MSYQRLYYIYMFMAVIMPIISYALEISFVFKKNRKYTGKL